jgi:hypothetical protein
LSLFDRKATARRGISRRSLDGPRQFAFSASLDEKPPPISL